MNKKTKVFRKQKIGFTYFLPKYGIILEYLTKHCDEVRQRKVDFFDEALENLFKKRKYQKLLNTERFKEFEKLYGDYKGKKMPLVKSGEKI